MPLASTLRQVRIIAPYAKGCAWAVPLLVGLSLAASLAESLAVSLVALFLFAAIGPGAGAMELGTGLLSRISDAAVALAGADALSLGALAGLLVVAKVCFSVGHSLIASIIKNVISERARNDVCLQYLTISYGYIQENDRGHLINVLSNESWKLAEVYYGLTRMAVNACAMVVFGAILIAISWQVTLVAAAGSLAALGTLRCFSGSIRRLGAHAVEANKRLAKHMVNTLHGMRTIRAYAQEESRLRSFEEASREARRTLVKLDVLQSGISPVSELAYLAVLAAVVWMSAAWQIQFATTLIAVALLYRLQPHMREFERNRLHIDRLSASLAAVESVVLRTDKSYPKQGTREYAGLRDEIRFSRVSFSYPGTDARSLKKASFTIPAGITTAVVGPSGAGKTTIVNLLLRLYDPSSGSILVDGEPLEALDRTSWLSRVAVAGQDAELIEDTVLENIRLSRQDATPAEIRHAAELAGIADFIDALPDGYHSHIGEYGLKLSGGQRQRIGLARALLRGPDILILDEATNAVDGFLEAQIRGNVSRAMAGRTLVIITHRLESLLGVDEVLSIDDGQVVDQGPPEALLMLRNGRWHHAASRQIH